MKRLIALTMVLLILVGCMPSAAMAKKNNQMNEGVPVWTEDTVREYALDYIGGMKMSKLWGYYDLQIRRYMPMTTYESILIDLEWLTGAFVTLGGYRSFEEPESMTKTHVLHLCMEKQDLDMYFSHKNKEDDWEVMGLNFVPAEKETISDGRDMLVADENGAVLAPALYTETESTIGAAPYVLGATFTMPNTASANVLVPACVLVHDSGALDRDSTMGQTKFFADLAHALAKMGIASIRYDKRSFAYADEMASVYDEVVEDAILAGKLLVENPFVDKSRVVVIGHGFSAALAPRIVSQADGVFTAMIMIGGTPKPLLETMLASYKAEIAGLDAEILKTLKTQIGKLPTMKEEEARALTFFGQNGYYFWEMAQYDAIKILKKLKLPTYIVQGRKDPVVTEDAGWRAYSEEIGDGVTYVGFKSFCGLNHILMNDLNTNAAGVPEYSVATMLDTQAGRNLAQWVLGLYAIEQTDE